MLGNEENDAADPDMVVLGLSEVCLAAGFDSFFRFASVSLAGSGPGFGMTGCQMYWGVSESDRSSQVLSRKAFSHQSNTKQRLSTETPGRVSRRPLVV